MTLMRLPDWEERLTEFLRERRDMPFTWGRNDCALFACDAVLAMTGTDLAEWFRARPYATALEAARRIRQFTDGGSLSDVARRLAERHSIEEIGPAFATLGDVVLADGPAGRAGPMLGISGGHADLYIGEAGIEERGADSRLKTWRI